MEIQGRPELPRGLLQELQRPPRILCTLSQPACTGLGAAASWSACESARPQRLGVPRLWLGGGAAAGHRPQAPSLMWPAFHLLAGWADATAACPAIHVLQWECSEQCRASDDKMQQGWS